jgi:GNAT superfamily N-acetyltransferase
MNIDIRPAELGDAEAIGRVDFHSHLEAYRSFYGADFLTGVGSKGFIERWKPILRGEAPPQRQPEHLIVAERDGEVIGYAGFGRARDEDAQDCGELYAIYIDPQHWRTGAGSVLIVDVTQRLSELGYTIAILWVLAENARARTFYERQGWSADGASQMRLDGHVQVRYRIPIQGSA